MATKNWNNDFMAKVLEEAAWKELSSEFAWNEPLLEKYKDKVSWKEISGNRNILWTASMIEKFKNKVDWEELSGSDNEHLFTAENLEKYKEYWNWRELSSANAAFFISIKLLPSPASLPSDHINTQGLFLSLNTILCIRSTTAPVQTGLEPGTPLRLTPWVSTSHSSIT